MLITSRISCLNSSDLAGRLERNTDRAADRAGCYKVSAAECGLEIVECLFVGEVDKCHAARKFDAFGTCEIVAAKAQVVKITRSDTGRIRVVICCAVCGDTQTKGTARR